LLHPKNKLKNSGGRRSFCLKLKVKIDKIQKEAKVLAQLKIKRC